MPRPNFPDIVVEFEIFTPDGVMAHCGNYRLADDTERRAFGQRCHEAMRDGFEIRTRRAEKPRAQYNR